MKPVYGLCGCSWLESALRNIKQWFNRSDSPAQQVRAVTEQSSLHLQLKVLQMENSIDRLELEQKAALAEIIVEVSRDHLWPHLVRIQFSSLSETHRLQQSINTATVMEELPARKAKRQQKKTLLHPTTLWVCLEFCLWTQGPHQYVSYSNEPAAMEAKTNRNQGRLLYLKYERVWWWGWKSTYLQVGVGM